MASLRDLAARAIQSPPASALLTILERLDPGRTDRVIVLTYHRVDDPAARPHLAPGLISATPDEFETQVEFFARHMQPLTMGEVLQTLKQGASTRRAVHLTFDDAYRDFAEHAWPILRRVGVPATLFVPTAMPTATTGFWWDRLHNAIHGTRAGSIRWHDTVLNLSTPEARNHAYSVLHDAIHELPPVPAAAAIEQLTRALSVPNASPEILSWDEIRAMVGEGLELGAHTRTHPRLDRMDADAARDEIAGSMADIARETGALTHRVFAYPHGDHGPPAPRAAQASEVEAAFTTARGAIELGAADRLRLRRINVGRRASLGAIRAQSGSWMRWAGY